MQVKARENKKEKVISVYIKSNVGSTDKVRDVNNVSSPSFENVFFHCFCIMVILRHIKHDSLRGGVRLTVLVSDIWVG
jgi:hypothetical protein